MHLQPTIKPNVYLVTGVDPQFDTKDIGDFIAYDMPMHDVIVSQCINTPRVYALIEEK